MSQFSDQLKQRADLAQIIGEVVALRPGGNGFIGLCPFHNEKTPSFHVHTAKRFYYCFGCHAHGDVYRFFMDLRKIGFPEAVELVAERMGVEVPRAADAAAADPLRRELLRVHALARDYFAEALAGRLGAAARAYLESRELPAAAVQPFHLGYAPESGRGLVQFLEGKKVAPALALRSGLCQLRRESAARQRPEPDANAVGWSDLYDRFRHRLMFPIQDERGQTIAFGGRALANDDKSPKYLNSPEHPLYTKGKVLYNLDRAREAIRNLDHSILVEGYFDCLRVFLAGFQNVVASCGTALTSAQIVPLGRLSKNAVVNFDPDTAGAAAAERSIGLLLEEGFKMRVVLLEGGLDPDLFIRRQGAAGYAAALRSSRSFFDYLGERARGQYDLRRGEGKLQAVNHLLPFISHIHEPILRQSAAENLAA
ncbi:MAG TPA: DNA primase, partial [Terriglobales bacterium]|nr:DNA primase [Terriglobales bacterium]